MSMMKIDLII